VTDGKLSARAPPVGESGGPVAPRTSGADTSSVNYVRLTGFICKPGSVGEAGGELHTGAMEAVSQWSPQQVADWMRGEPDA